MKRGVVILVLLLVAIIPLTNTPEVAAADPWASAYADWQYRTAVTISNPNSYDLTDFQVKITLDSSWPGWDHVNQDGSDIRFADAQGNVIPCYVESWDYTNKQAVIWVKVPSIPANGSVTIYLYYGNTNAASENNGEAVFEFFDDFNADEGWTLFGANSVKSYEISDSLLHLPMFSSNVDGCDEGVYRSVEVGAKTVIETKMRIYKTTSTGTTGLFLTKGTDWNSGQYLVFGATGDGTFGIVDWLFDTSGISSLLSFDAEYNDYHIWTIKKNGNGYTLYFDGEEKGTVTRTNTPLNYIVFGVPYNDNELWVDWVRVRKYADQEPSASVSTTEETNTATTYTITLSLKDDAGTSLTGVTITVEDSAGNTVITGTYDDGGFITVTQTGTYTIHAEKEGYVPAGASVNVDGSGSSYTVSLTLVEIPSPTISYTPSLVHVGDKITVTASAPDKDGYTWSYEYRFEDSAGNVLQDWSTTNTYTVPQSLAHSSLVIKARTVDTDSGGHSPPSSVTVTIENSPPSAPTLSLSPSAHATVEYQITATASGSSDPDGDTITYEYKFVDLTNNNAILQDWSTTNTYTPTTNEDGHVIRVYARAKDDQGAYSNEVYQDITVDNHLPSAPTSLTLSSGLHVGKAVAITASGSTDQDGDTITYEYRIVDKTTGTVLQDWNTTNTWTPSDSQLYHTIEIFARAKDTLNTYSDAVSRVYFVLPGETIADVPFDSSKVKSKVEFVLSTAWTDITGLMVKTDGQDNMFLLASFNGVHWWLELSGDKAILYSDNEFGPLLTPILSDMGSSKWARDYVQKFIDFAADAGTLEGTAIAPGTYIQSYTAYVAGISENATMYATWLSAHMDWRDELSWTLSNLSAKLNKVGLGWYAPDASSFKLDVYSDEETPGASPEVDSAHSSGVTTVSVVTLNSWLSSRSVNFYTFEGPSWGGDVRVRFISVGPRGYAPPSGAIGGRMGYSSSSQGSITIDIQPLPVPTTVTFYFYDDQNNQLNGVDVYLGGTFLGTFNSGQCYNLSYAGTYTFTAKKLHYYDSTKTVYLEGNAGLSFTLTPVEYTVTVKAIDAIDNTALNATFYVDGAAVGTGTSITTKVRYGTHVFRATAEGYSPAEQELLIDEDNKVITLKLYRPVDVTFKIYDASNVTDLASLPEMTGVTVVINGEVHVLDSGATLSLNAGQYTFEFKKDGYITTKLSADIKSDTTIVVYMFKGVSVLDTINMTLNFSPSQEMDEVMNLFSHWPGGGALKRLVHLDVKGFISDLLGMHVGSSTDASWAGTFMVLILWLQGVLVAWFYHKSPLPVFAFGRLLYEGLNSFVPLNPAIAGPVVAGFSLFMGYLLIKDLLAKWSGEV